MSRIASSSFAQDMTPRHFAYPKGYWDAGAETVIRRSIRHRGARRRLHR